MLYSLVLTFLYYSGLYKSTDNGNSWNEIETQFDPFEIYALYISKAGDILVGTNHQGRIYRSTDNGLTWENNNSGYNTGECWSFGETNGFLFAGSGEGAVYRSSNGGDSWEFSDNLPALCFAADSNDIIYCGAHSGLFKSTDKGASWTNFNLFSNRAVSSIIIDSANHLYVSTGYYNNGNGVYYSSDGGDNWIKLGLEGRVALSIAIDSKGSLYAGTKQDGIFKTTNMGNTWSQHLAGIEGIEVFRLKINTQDQIFIGSENEGVFRSINDGNSFTQVGLPISHIQNIDFGRDKNFIFASTPSGVQRYNRIKGIWTNLGLKNVESVSVSPSGAVYAATYWEGVYLSTDEGENWEFQFNNVNARYNFKAFTDSLLLDAAAPNLRISTNAGTSWEATNIASDPNACAILFNNGNIFTHGFRNFESKIYYKNISVPLFSEIITPSDISRKNGLAISKVNHDMFFINGQGNLSPGIYMNTFPPSGWVQKYSGISTSIYIDTNNFIYSGASEGVLRSTDNGNDWVNIFNENNSRAFAHDLKIDGSKLFIATNSYGLYEMQLVTGVEDENIIIKENQLFQNYPNPFNPKTIIRFDVKSPGFVEIKIFNILGKELLTLLNEYRQTGRYEVEFDASTIKNIPSGVYFYRMINGSYSETRKLVLLR